MREKESLECVRMHIWALKTQKLPGPLSGPWTPAANCSLRSRDFTSLCRQLSASEAGAPPWPNPGSAPVYWYSVYIFDIFSPAPVSSFIAQWENAFEVLNRKFDFLFNGVVVDVTHWVYWNCMRTECVAQAYAFMPISGD